MQLTERTDSLTINNATSYIQHLSNVFITSSCNISKSLHVVLKYLAINSTAFM